MTSPFVRIIFTNWNGGAEPLACLASVAALAYPRDRLETVMVDNGSTDGSPEAVTQAFPNVRLIRNRGNRGFGPAVNQGAAGASADYLFITNDDVALEPGSLAALVGALESDPGVGAAGGRMLAKDDPGRTVAAGFRFRWATGLLQHPGAPDRAKDVDFVEGAGLCIRRSLWERLGGFDERFVPAYWEDVDLGERVRAAGFRVRYVPEARLRHRGSASLAQLPRREAYAMGLVNRYRLYAKHRGRRGLVAFTLVHFLLSVPVRNLVRRDGSLPAELSALGWLVRRWGTLFAP